jgi:hypothetical protein
MILSIGYSKLTPKALAELAEACNALVVDVRAKPLSRRHDFDRKRLEALLGTRYEWRGDRLGGLAPGSKGPPPTLAEADLVQLADDSELRNIILLCLEGPPNQCHRHWTIAIPLLELGVDVWHLFDDEAIPASELVRWTEAGGAGPYYSAVASQIIAHAGTSTEQGFLKDDPAPTEA